MFIDNPETTVSEIIAPAAFLGDLRGFIGGTLSFDGNMLQAIGSPWSNAADYGNVTIAGSGGTAILNIVPGQPGLNTWTTYSIDLNAVTWGKTAAHWESLLANVTSLPISVEARFGGEQQGIDNVTLAGLSVPEGGSAALMLLFGVSSLAVAKRIRGGARQCDGQDSV